MPKQILLPELAESVVEGEIQRWLVAVGDRVEAEQPIVEVMTDKATVELPSPYSGVVHQLLAAEGQVVPVHAPIAILLDDGEAPGAVDVMPIVELKPDASLFKPSDDVQRVKNPFLARRIRVTPAARKVARDRGVNLETIAGSGPHGRIRVSDVLAANEATAKEGTGGLERLAYRAPSGYETREQRTPIRGIRRTIVEQMTASHLHTVRTLVVDEADFSALTEVRDRLRPPFEADGARLNYLPFICRAVARALDRFPPLNASIDEASQEIVLKRYCNIGLAVATDNGLVVPVVRDVADKSLLELAREIEDLAARARRGDLRPIDVAGSTFTVSSIGSVGTLFSFPIINLPNAGILGVHTIKRRPAVVVEEGEERIAIRSLIYLSLSFDHRLIDGATAANFLRDLIESLEAPETLAT